MKLGHQAEAKGAEEGSTPAPAAAAAGMICSLPTDTNQFPGNIGPRIPWQGPEGSVLTLEIMTPFLVLGGPGTWSLNSGFRCYEHPPTNLSQRETVIQESVQLSVAMCSTHTHTHAHTPAHRLVTRCDCSLCHFRVWFVEPGRVQCDY